MSAGATDHPHERFWERDGRRVIDCRTCGYRHLDPLPEAEDLDRFYRSAYHREIKPFPYDKVDDAFVARHRAKIDGHREYRTIFETVQGFVDGLEGHSMLDVGCGNQLLARFFSDRGWQARAFEPNRDAAAWLRRFGIDVVESMFGENPELGMDGFSFVNVQFVLEHLLDPLDALRAIGRMTVPGGILRVCVPNDFSEGQLAWLERSGMEPPWISWPDHVNYFDFDSLSGLLDRAGFSEITRAATFPLEFLLLSGIDYYADEAERARVGPIINAFEGAFYGTGREALLRRYYEGLARLGFGRSAILYARRR